MRGAVKTRAWQRKGPLLSAPLRSAHFLALLCSCSCSELNWIALRLAICNIIKGKQPRLFAICHSTNWLRLASQSRLSLILSLTFAANANAGNLLFSHLQIFRDIRTRTTEDWISATGTDAEIAALIERRPPRAVYNIWNQSAKVQPWRRCTWITSSTCAQRLSKWSGPDILPHPASIPFPFAVAVPRPRPSPSPSPRPRPATESGLKAKESTAGGDPIGDNSIAFSTNLRFTLPRFLDGLH